MPSSQVPPIRKSPRKDSKDIVDTVGNLDTKQPIVPTRKAIKNKGQKVKTQQNKKQNSKGDSKGKGHLDMSKIKCFNCGEYGHFAHVCPKAHDNTNIAQESEQSGKLETMLDLDSTSACEECVMICTELQYEDADDNQIVYGDQRINAEEYEKATYDDLVKTQSEEEAEVKCIVAQRANDSVILERKRRQFNENNPDEKPDGDSQSAISISENSTVKSINKSTLVAQGPADDNDENESRKAWIMEMLTNDGDISMSMMNEQESMSEDEKSSYMPEQYTQTI